MKRLNISVSEELHRFIKIEAAFDSSTINDYVNKAIVEKIERDKKKRRENGE